MKLFELTICSVNYKHSKHLMENIELVKLLNPRTKIKWIIANNEPDKNILVDIIKSYSDSVKIDNSPQNNCVGIGKGSKNHATGLNLIITKVKTRFVLILDPDFYLILPDWVERIIKYMTQNNIALFGVPLHPKWEVKYRYFPCVHCLLVDTKYIDLSSLSFMPEFENIDPLNIWRRIISKVPLIRGRASIGRSKDTGYKIYEKYYNSPGIKHALAIPSFSNTDLYNKYYKINDRTKINRWILFNKILDKIFPDSMSMFPKKKGYFTKVSFSELGFPDCKNYGWEEFFWNNEPFGFHMRGFQQKIIEPEVEIERIKNVLKGFVDKLMKTNLKI